MKIKLITPNAIVPTRGTTDSAGLDLYADLEKPAVIKPGITQLIPTGIAMAIPSGYAGFIYARSSLATKNGLRPANCVAVIDADYRGELIVPIHNDSNTDQVIHHTQRFAQLVIAPVSMEKLEVVTDLPETMRGNGGFGSTGTM